MRTNNVFNSYCNTKWLILFFFLLFIFAYSNTNNDDMVTLELLGSENFMRHNFLNIQKSNLWLNDYFHIFIIYKISNEHFRPDISFLKWKRICWILFEDFYYFVAFIFAEIFHESINDAHFTLLRYCRGFTAHLNLAILMHCAGLRTDFYSLFFFIIFFIFIIF